MGLNPDTILSSRTSLCLDCLFFLYKTRTVIACIIYFSNCGAECLKAVTSERRSLLDSQYQRAQPSSVGKTWKWGLVDSLTVVTDQKQSEKVGGAET